MFQTGSTLSSVLPFSHLFVIGDLNFLYKGWLIYSSGTNRPG